LALPDVTVLYTEFGDWEPLYWPPVV
jgi:hypothetical protein